ncbi:MAG: 3-hydroxyacyl-ACP dehydratase FabZ family protein [Planctomycetota bacterium]|jgi:3-hydroxyacyl-[acyl-carrier-protein] dehydratase
MASPLLLDLDAIDLDAVAADEARVGEVNPQCGLMRQLDYVVWFNDIITQGVGVKQVRDDEFWVPYHIPGRPLMPGVMMIEACAQLGSFLYRTKTPNLPFVGFTRCNDTVFRGQVVPGDRMLILCDEVEASRRRFISRFQCVVEGKMVMETTITGMTF